MKSKYLPPRPKNPVLIFIFLTFLSGCATIYNPATGRNEFYLIDDNSEVSIGSNIAQGILRQEKIVKDQKTISYVTGVGEKLAKSSDRNYLPYHFYIVDNKELNAFAVPGGYIFVHTGLLDKVNEDELAFVLGHEIGHVAARHSIKKMQAALGFSIIMSLALKKPDSRLIRDAVNVMYDIIERGYSRQDELLADSLGIKYMKKTGYNLKGAISLLERLKKEDKGSAIPPFLRTHPLSDERIKNVKEQIEKISLVE